MAYFDSVQSSSVHTRDPRPQDAAWARLDPSSALRRLLALDDPPRGLAEDALLGWLIALPGGVDPAEAARELAGRPELTAREGEAARLRGLLCEVSRYPAAALSRGRRRR